MRNLVALGAIVTSLAMAGTAHAATVVQFTPGAASPAPTHTVIYDFDTTFPASLITTPLVQIKSPPSDPQGAPPANSSPSGTDYLSVLGGGFATILFGGPVSAFSFDWGSIDSYNTLTILPFTGTESIVIPGTTFTNTPANGNQVAPGTNGRFTVTGTEGTLYRGFELTSTQNSFEIDNVAVVRAVPEPASWAMMIGGFGLVGGAMRRRARVRTTVRFA